MHGVVETWHLKKCPPIGILAHRWITAMGDIYPSLNEAIQLVYKWITVMGNLQLSGKRVIHHYTDVEA